MSSKARFVVGVASVALVAASGATGANAQSNQTRGGKTGVRAEHKAKSKKTNPRTKAGSVAKDSAKTDESQPRLKDESGRLEGDIIVTGLRENVKSARSAKRHAQQIVDVVVAQDIGKLPDKNVPEALARVPGVQIDRDRGEGGSFAEGGGIRIRGLDNVMTTINGSPSFSADKRTTFVQDISSDLVSSIEVYKTRTPDQVEGSQTGVINISLRRPTDFKTGATYALSARADYADQVKKVNPYYSALIAYNAETPIGRLGFSVNANYNHLSYNEGVRYNALPDWSWDQRQIITPSTTIGNIYVPRNVGFAGTNGWSKRAAFQISTQWKPDDHWNITLEGGYANQKMLWADNLFGLQITQSQSAAPPPRLSNIVLSDDGRLVKSLTVDSVDPFGPGRQSWLHETSDYNGRLQLDYSNERFEFTSWINYRRSDNDSNNIFHYLRFSQQPQFDVVFNTPNNPKGGSEVTFKNIDLMDKGNYLYLDGIDQSRQYTYSAATEMKADLKINTFFKALDWFKVGFRRERRTYDRGYVRRVADAIRLPLNELSGYNLTTSGRVFQGSSAEWMIGDTNSIRNSWGEVVRRIHAVKPDFDGYYPAYNPLAGYGGSEGSYAFYGMAHYDVKLLFPIEGSFGTRIVNSLVGLTSTERLTKFENVDGRMTEITTDTISKSHGNALDLMPSFNAIMHFTPKLQLRTSWTHEVGRPNAWDLNSRLVMNLENQTRPTASGGNPKLGPIKTDKYDASLEWYFGNTGSISLAVWQWNQDGFIANKEGLEYLPESPDVPTLVVRPQNLGKGRHRGIEASATTFFTFLPGILKSFGASVNGTMNITRQAFPYTDASGNSVYTYGPYLNVSKYLYNIVGFFERGGVNLRVAYNWQSRKQLWVDARNPYNNLFLDPIERLDASINYDVTKQLTVALEAANLTRAGGRDFWGSYEVPRDVHYYSRNFSLSVRTRF
jgi:iron complex outermembrane receptor protein